MNETGYMCIHKQFLVCMYTFKLDMPSKQAYATYVPRCHLKTQHEKFYIPVPAWYFAMQ